MIKEITRKNILIANKIEKYLDAAFDEIQKLSKNKYGAYIGFDQVDNDKIKSGKNQIKEARKNFRHL